MNTEATLHLATKMVSEWATETQVSEPNRVDGLMATSEDLLNAVMMLRVKRLGYLAAITGIDLGLEAGEFEVLYHFCAGPVVITLRIRTPRETPSVPSLSHYIPSAEPFERELSEMFGVAVVGIPNPERLYLPDDWPEGVYPLRKDFERSALNEERDHEYDTTG